MPAPLPLLIPLTFIAGIYLVAVRGRRPTFRPRAANARFRDVRGPLAATWLALLAATWGLLDLAGRGWLPLSAEVVVATLVAITAGLVLVPRSTLFVVAIAGLATQAAALVADHGLATALVLMVITGLMTWLFGATRGALSPRPGMGAVLLVGLAAVVGLSLLNGAPAADGDTTGAPQTGPAVPGAWDPGALPAVFPCPDPIVVRTEGASLPAEAEADLAAAVTAVAEGTGRNLRLEVTPQVPGIADGVVTVSWVTDRAALHADEPDAQATGGPVTRGGRVVSGEVTVLVPGMPPTGGGPGSLQVLLQHELLHALGVSGAGHRAHSTDPGDVMYPRLGTQTPAWGPGDRNALTRVGCP